jgi:uncharacterized membrane protein
MNYPQGRPRRAVTREARMSTGESLVHAVLMLVTFGLWIPVYAARKRDIRHKPRVTTYEY